jgi:hypothetical protein
MPVPFFVTTAEHLVAAVEAVVVRGSGASAEYVAEFAEIQVHQAESALNLAVDLGVLTQDASGFVPTSPLARSLCAANEALRAAALRIILEQYRPFIGFRERLSFAATAAAAAHQVKTLLDLDAHRDGIRDTLVSLGTYSRALSSEGAGRYKAAEGENDNPLLIVAGGTRDLAAAEADVRNRIGTDAADVVSRDEVLLPLADALIRAVSGDHRGAVVHAGNATESFLEQLAARRGVNVLGAHGINAKLERLAQAGFLPTKLVAVGRYLGHVRNAADHGVDQDINQSWEICAGTGAQYPQVACTFISNVVARENGRPSNV